ncbi:WhiB-like iron-sulfur binding domain containing protein [uncultured Caudovirales phage]|uniref:WhiB-like iron-sulfur binding domain containing protein n=1 Tax=uncultured Caudovirales phage TaxID=2100421 RepID=A0A6J5QYC4_9CAUD|nr:WhiB-like iron-sulfur binding domain containing protein [uncultured Caudovirales phage]CAB4179920.1 WhiB-like iron-sulfur binding domain containing protein [uncultured Caudovirales phage]CAB4188762.1 WhiB-like iron-sulfur binding domain containing protein [uncultured Caudovirales phage]
MLGTSGQTITGTRWDIFDGTEPCVGVGVEMFYPEDPRAANKIKLALKPLCDSCAVKHGCLQIALDNNERGIWAATTEQDRHMMRRRKGKILK